MDGNQVTEESALKRCYRDALNQKKMEEDRDYLIVCFVTRVVYKLIV